MSEIKIFQPPPPPNKKALAILQVENPINWPLILFVFYSYIIAHIYFKTKCNCNQEAKVWGHKLVHRFLQIFFN